ncbi:hypothetical protein CGGC5_v017221 [Colletotrichum fructicola Nara gc5]|uniref:Uncharacterized protein n=1 Tax=Colletotrichum fructicola (strain Nara gc5) TaxID=1213859 RepID=A0A7J6ICJ6_COLFN|nr:hypothetical protein CGGC5_v017221 [Colletotrichum fructicola Nara gc5]
MVPAVLSPFRMVISIVETEIFQCNHVLYILTHEVVHFLGPIFSGDLNVELLPMAPAAHRRNPRKPSASVEHGYGLPLVWDVEGRDHHQGPFIVRGLMESKPSQFPVWRGAFSPSAQQTNNCSSVAIPLRRILSVDSPGQRFPFGKVFL